MYRVKIKERPIMICDDGTDVERAWRKKVRTIEMRVKEVISTNTNGTSAISSVMPTIWRCSSILFDHFLQSFGKGKHGSGLFNLFFNCLSQFRDKMDACLRLSHHNRLAHDIY